MNEFYFMIVLDDEEQDIAAPARGGLGFGEAKIIPPTPKIDRWGEPIIDDSDSGWANFVWDLDFDGLDFETGDIVLVEDVDGYGIVTGDDILLNDGGYALSLGHPVYGSAWESLPEDEIQIDWWIVLEEDDPTLP